MRRSRRLRVFASSTESGYVAASGSLRVSGLTLPLRVSRRSVAVPGGGTELVVTLTLAQHRQLLRALRRHRAVSAALVVVATDRAGNSRAARPIRIGLVR